MAQQTLVHTGTHVDVPHEAVAHSIADNAIVTVDDAAAGVGEYAVFTANGLEGAVVLTTTTSVDSAAVADSVSLGGYEISAGHRALAISSEEVVVAETLVTKFSHKLPVRINGVTYNIMLCAT